VPAAGEPDIVNKLKAGYTANGITYKVHLDGYDQSAFLRNVSGTAGNNKRHERAPATSSSTPTTTACWLGLRKGRLHVRLRGAAISRNHAGLGPEPFTKLRLSKIYNLFQDPVRAGRHLRPTRIGTGRSTTLDNSTARMDDRIRVHGDIQGVPAALVPAELRADDSIGRRDGCHQGRQAEKRLAPDKPQTKAAGRHRVGRQSPKGPFFCGLALYWPKPAALNGKLEAPPLQRVGSTQRRSDMNTKRILYAAAITLSAIINGTRSEPLF